MIQSAKNLSEIALNKSLSNVRGLVSMKGQSVINVDSAIPANYPPITGEVVKKTYIFKVIDGSQEISVYAYNDWAVTLFKLLNKGSVPYILFNCDRAVVHSLPETTSNICCIVLSNSTIKGISKVCDIF